MDNCMHGIDVRNPCETCLAVEHLSPSDQAHFEKRVRETLARLNVGPSGDHAQVLLGELALAFNRGIRHGQAPSYRY